MARCIDAHQIEVTVDRRQQNRAVAGALDHPSSTALRDFDSLPQTAHVRVRVVAALWGISSPTVWRWAKEGLLPAPVKLGPNTTAWRVSDLRNAFAKQGNSQPRPRK
jgi:predicted DNA-binding transcriptional regulator AlpA